jgi:hypothetical protein
MSESVRRLPGALLRNCLLLTAECGAALLLRESGAPWIPVLLGLCVLASAVPHGTDAEFTARIAVAVVAVGVAAAGAEAWEAWLAHERGIPVPPPWEAVATAALLLVQTVAVTRLSLRRA